MEQTPTNLPPGPTPERHRTTVLLLAATSGALDAVGFLGLGGVFASVMTGNLVLLGLGVGARNGSLATHAVVAIAAYVVGVVAAVRIARTRPGAPFRSRPVLLVELVLLVGFTVGWELAHGRPGIPVQLVLVGVAACAMGLQGAAVRESTGGGLSTTYLTGTLTGVVTALASGRSVREASTGGTVLAASLAGAVVAGLVLMASRAWVPIVPLAALAGALVAGGGQVAAAGDAAPDPG